MFYVFHGDDAFSRAEELASLVARMGDPEMTDLNTTRLDGRTVTLDEIQHHCDTVPFFADRRLVIIEELLTRLAQKEQKSELDALVAYLPHLPPTTRLILIEDHQISRTHPVLALARESDLGYVKAFRLPTGNGLTRWIQKRVKRAGGQITPGAIRTLSAFVENDLYQLNQEIEKLVAYTDGQRPISEEDVALLTPPAREANVFEMVDALGRRDGKTASHMYHQLLDAGEHPLALFGMITRQFRLMIQIKELAPQLLTPETIARELRQNPYPIKKIFRQSDNYDMAQLQTIYHKLLETDVAIKTGQVDAALALDLLIAGLSRFVQK
jgi:DNA polymerase-3 subunit delta